ncbi:putative cell morphogenesis protein (PAG1) [Corchorus olitorius]|uniref:Cell morphogenesis protein (PAG1) n=1 Tax=Corchorus olitorius TaxID=93759 RepID=A0A1R3JCB1_9ROSI|nr:putative cell morphogenesis protein (PAG1) [Corchorus olitorius]
MGSSSEVVVGTKMGLGSGLTTVRWVKKKSLVEEGSQGFVELANVLVPPFPRTLAVKTSPWPSPSLVKKLHDPSKLSQLHKHYSVRFCCHQHRIAPHP